MDDERDVLIRKAELVLQKHPGAMVFFKFTCCHCGNRCTFSEPNTVFDRGTCCECGKKTPFIAGGFTLICPPHATA